MKIETKVAPMRTLEQFADEHDLTLVVEEYLGTRFSRFWAYLKYCVVQIEDDVGETQWGVVQGAGHSIEEAICEYIQGIQGRKARVSSASAGEDGPVREIKIPWLCVGPLDLSEVHALCDLPAKSRTSAEKEQARLHREPKQEDHLQGAIQDLQKVQKHLEALVVQARKMSGLTREKVMMLLVDVQKDIHVDMGYLKCIDDILMEDASSSGDQCE